VVSVLLSDSTGDRGHAGVFFRHVMPGIAIVDTEPSEVPWPGEVAEMGGASLLDVPRESRVGQRRLQTALADLCCRRGLAGLRSARAMDGRDVLTVVAGGGDQRFVETTLAVSRHFRLQIEIVAVVSTPPRTRSTQPTPDIVESMGAVSLARKFRDVDGVQPEWDVLHGPTPERALATYLHRTRPRLVALPHSQHRDTTRCDAVRAARHIDAAVLIA
jgi:hypothetical protein